VMWTHVELDVRGGKGCRPRTRQRIDLVVMMAGQNKIGRGGKRLVLRIAQQDRAPAVVGQELERVTEPLVIECLRTGTEVGDAVDLCTVAGDAVDGPLERLSVSEAGGHAERRNAAVVAP